MSISVTCPACQAKLKMPETLIGRKVRCKACQTVIPATVIPATVIPANVTLPATGGTPVEMPVSSKKMNSDEEGTANAADSNGTSEAAPVKSQTRTRRQVASTSRKSSPKANRGDASPPALPAWKRSLLYVSQRPWAAMLLLYLVAYAPIAFVFPVYTFRVELLAGLLLVLGIVGGTIMGLIGVSIKNPFEMLTLATIGVIAGAIMPTEYAAAVGKVAGKATGKAGKRPLGEADTGVGGSIAIYSCLGLVLLFVHTMVKSMVWVAAEKAKM